VGSGLCWVGGRGGPVARACLRTRPGQPVVRYAEGEVYIG